MLSEFANENEKKKKSGGSEKSEVWNLESLIVPLSSVNKHLIFTNHLLMYNLKVEIPSHLLTWIGQCQTLTAGLVCM